MRHAMFSSVPENIAVDVPIQVTTDEYLFIIGQFKGGIFHRRDEKGAYWVMPAYDFICDYLRQALSAFRQVKQKQQ